MDGNFNNQNPNGQQNGIGQGFSPQMQPPQYGPMMPQKPATDVLGIVSLVTGILSLLGCCCSWLGIVFGIAAIVCAALSRNQMSKFSGLAIGGLVCGIIGLGLGILGIIINIVYGDDIQKYYEEIVREIESMQ